MGVEIRGGPAIHRTLNALGGRELQNRTARATRAGAGVFRTALRSEVKSGRHPDSFRRIATRNHRNPIGTSVGPTSPLLNIFEGGADDHSIGSPGQLLHSQQGEPLFVARGPVHHPGMEARPLIGPVFDRTNEKAADAAMDEILKGLPR